MTAPIFYCRFAAPGSRRVRPGRWAWWITDGLTGPVLREGWALTEFGAHHAINRALQRCQVATGICRCDRPVLAPLTRESLTALNEQLEADRIPVTVQLPAAGVMQLWPLVALTTQQEAHAYRLVTAVTDMPITWAGA
jgi:hypothetical protein